MPVELRRREPVVTLMNVSGVTDAMPDSVNDC